MRKLKNSSKISKFENYSKFANSRPMLIFKFEIIFSKIPKNFFKSHRTKFSHISVRFCFKNHSFLMETPFFIKIGHFYQIWKLTLSDTGGSVFIFSTVSTRIPRSELVTSARWKFKNFENFLEKFLIKKFRSNFLPEFNIILSADFCQLEVGFNRHKKSFENIRKKKLPLNPKISQFLPVFRFLRVR